MLLTDQQLWQLAVAIQAEFPTEYSSLYYVPCLRAQLDKARKNKTGLLVGALRKKRDDLIALGILPPVKKRSHSGSPASDSRRSTPRLEVINLAHLDEGKFTLLS